VTLPVVLTANNLSSHFFPCTRYGTHSRSYSLFPLHEIWYTFAIISSPVPGSFTPTHILSTHPARGTIAEHALTFNVWGLGVVYSGPHLRQHLRTWVRARVPVERESHKVNARVQPVGVAGGILLHRRFQSTMSMKLQFCGSVCPPPPPPHTYTTTTTPPPHPTAVPCGYAITLNDRYRERALISSGVAWRRWAMAPAFDRLLCVGFSTCRRTAST
jgi:hypothetical protein